MPHAGECFSRGFPSRRGGGGSPRWAPRGLPGLSASTCRRGHRRSQFTLLNRLLIQVSLGLAGGQAFLPCPFVHPGKPHVFPARTLLVNLVYIAEGTSLGQFCSQTFCKVPLAELCATRNVTCMEICWANSCVITGGGPCIATTEDGPKPGRGLTPPALLPFLDRPLDFLYLFLGQCQSVHGRLSGNYC